MSEGDRANIINANSKQEKHFINISTVIKRCGNNNKDEDNSPKTLNDKNP